MDNSNGLFVSLRKQKFAIFFAVSFIVLLSLCLTFFFFFYAQQKKIIQERINSRQAVALTECKDKFDQELEAALKNFLLLYQLPDLKEYLENSEEQEKAHLERELLAIARINGIYGQIRFIDENGKEKIRIHKEDGQYVVVNDNDLQDKSSRYYFKNIMKLAKGEIYISPFDLNIEHGKLDPTNQITMRIGICAYDPKGNKNGVFIVNYYVKENITALYNEKCVIIQLNPGTAPLFLARDGLKDNLKIDKIKLKKLYDDRMKNINIGKGKIYHLIFQKSLISFCLYSPYDDLINTNCLEKLGMYLSPASRYLKDLLILNIKSNAYVTEEFKQLRKSLFFLVMATIALLTTISFFIAKLGSKYYQSVSDLREERDRLNLATQSTKSRVWAFFPKTNTFWLSGTYKNKESAGEILLDSIDDRYKNEFMEFISGKSMDDDNISEFEFETVSGDGRGWQLARGFAVGREINGDPLKITGTVIDITSKKENELMLKTLESAVSSASIGMLLVGIVGNNNYSIMYMNEEAAKSLPSSHEDYLNNSFERYLLDMNLSQEQIKTILAEAESVNSYNCEIKIKQPGSEKDLWLQVNMEQVEDSVAKNFMWLQYDISSLKEAELVLARGNAELEAEVSKRTFELNEANSKLSLYLKALDYAANGIVITDASGNVAWCNQAMESLTGYSKDEIVGNTPRIFKSGKHDDAFYKNIWETIEQGQFWNGEIINKKKNGDLYMEEMTAAPVFDPTGKITNYVAIKSDISEKKANEKKFMAQAAFMRNNPAPVFKVGYKSKKVIECNQGYEKLFGESIGGDIEEILPGLLKNSLETKGTLSEFEVKIKDSHFLFAVAKVVKQDALYIYGTDITNLKNLQEEQKELNSQLVKSLKSFQEINFELQIANQHRTQFLSSMNHELRTPLNAIIGFSSMLHQQFFGKLNEKQLEYVEQIEDSGKHLLDLINDLLDMAKVDAGKMILLPATCTVSEFVEPILKMLQLQMKKKQQSLNSEIDEKSLPCVYCDIRRSKQIILNLLSNAIKYTPKDGKILLKAAFLSDRGKVQIDVIDNGPGIPDEEKENIFSEFYQLDNLREENIAGTGIGLALTKRLVELQGGRIWLEDADNGGCKFSFTVPVSREGLVSVPDQKKTSVDFIIDASGKKILVAEDNEVNVSLMRNMLQLTNCEIIFAKNGKEAIDMALEHTPDLIFMDIRMPKMDGLEATRLLRKNKEISKIPIIAVTASTGTEVQDTQIKAGCTDHLPKPVQINQIFDMLRKYL